MKKILLYLLLLHVLVLCSFSQRIWLGTIGSLDSTKSGSFSSLQTGISVDLPKQVSGYSGEKGLLYNWRLTEGYYYVGVESKIFDVENTDKFKTETGKSINEIYNGIAGDLFETPSKIFSASEKEINYQGHKGIELRATLTDTVMIIRVFWIKNTVYKIAVLLTEKQKQFETQAIKVLNSLKVISKEEKEKIIKEKFDEATPQPLPQSPITQKVKSDAEDENLKGKVKSILQESKYIKGTKADSPKQKESEGFYNEDGNWLKRISYDSHGLPFQIRVYGYIDGNRVEKAGFIYYGLIFPGPPRPVSPNAPKRDLRYSMKFAYKYDDKNRLSEEIVYSNDGTIWTKSVFTYNENTVEEIRYQDNGKNSSKNIKTFDSKENEIESVYFGLNSDKFREKSIYKYIDFDKNGNWIKRTRQYFTNNNETEKEEWIEEEFRTITYYE